MRIGTPSIAFLSGVNRLHPRTSWAAESQILSSILRAPRRREECLRVLRRAYILIRERDVTCMAEMCAGAACGRGPGGCREKEGPNGEPSAGASAWGCQLRRNRNARRMGKQALFVNRHIAISYVCSIKVAIIRQMLSRETGGPNARISKITRVKLYTRPSQLVELSMRMILVVLYF